MTSDIFVTATRRDGRMAGVYEYDEDTGYFYLCEVVGGQPRVVDAIHIVSAPSNLDEESIEVRWSGDERCLALLIHGEPWAAYCPAERGKYGGNYTPDGIADLPATVKEQFPRV